jgi:integrative and conjugative element protein (TIGR02256 family)
MVVLVPSEIVSRLRAELRVAGRVEVGGLLMGEHLKSDKFKIADITAQQHGGTRTGLVRDPKEHAALLSAFFDRTGRDYTRFNYVGEWHSHPCSPPTPSVADVAEMKRLVDDPNVGANFLVLIVVKLRWFGRLAATATLFAPWHTPEAVQLLWEPARRRRSA